MVLPPKGLTILKAADSNWKTLEKPLGWGEKGQLDIRAWLEKVTHAIKVTYSHRPGPSLTHPSQS